MDREDEFIEIKKQIEEKINTISIPQLDDLSNKISELIKKWSAGETIYTDPVLEAAASVASSLEDLSSDMEYVISALTNLDVALTKK